MKDLNRLLEGLLIEKCIPPYELTDIVKTYEFQRYSLISLIFDCRLWYDESMKNVKISRDLASLTKEGKRLIAHI